MRAAPYPVDVQENASDNLAVELRQVSKTFRSRTRQITALDRVDLQVQSGRITGLVGPDAAGKTTLMRLIAALMLPDSGDVHVLGMPAQDHPQDIQSAIAYMPQQFGLYEDLTVNENLDLYADLHGMAGPLRAERSRQLLQMAGLNRFRSRRAGHLSGGMKQKLGLACALIGQRPLLLLDEPTAGVDPLSRRELWQIVDQLVEQEHLTVLVSTAYLDEAANCDDVAVLHQGHLLAFGRPTDLLDDVKGRVFLVQAPGTSKLHLRQQLRHESSVLEATVTGNGVRVLTTTAQQPSLDRLRKDHTDIDVEAVTPRFEDSFVAVLRGAGAASQPQETTGSAAPTTGPSKKIEDGVAISVHDVHRRFGSFYAVKGISFDVRRGEIFGLLGANGAGKSTTFRMLCGLLPATSGRLLVAGTDLHKAAAAARRRIGYMAQKFSLYGKLSVRDNLTFFSSAYGLTGSRQRERIGWALDQFELAESANVPSLELPLGYRQRLSMACALMHEPEIVFLDEPTSGVDPLARREFWDHILELAAHGVTIMVTTHFMNEAEYCDRIAIMNEGQILTIDTPSEIRRSRRTAQGAVPSMEEAFVQLIQETRNRHA